MRWSWQLLEGCVECEADVKDSGRVAILLFVFLASLYFLTLRLPPTGGDDRTMLAVAIALVEEGRFDLDPEFNPTGGVRGRENRVYSKYPIGQSLAEIPFYFAGKALSRLFVSETPVWGLESARRAFAAQCVVGLPALLTAGTCVLFFYLCLRLGATVQTALVASLLLGVGSILWPYSGSLLSEPLQTFLLVLTVYLVRVHITQGRFRALLAGGLAFGALVAVRPNMVLVLPVLWAYVILGSRLPVAWRGVACAALVPGLAVGLAVTLGYNWLRFGQWLQFGYVGERFSSPMYTGLWAYVFSPGRSVLLYSPVLVVAAAGVREFWRRHRPEAVLVWGSVAVLALFYAKWHSWSGAHCWGPRFLMPVVPFSMLSSVWVLEGWRHSLRRWHRVAIVALVAAGILVQVPGVAIDPLFYYHVVFGMTTDVTVHHLLGDCIDFVPHFSPLAGNTWLLGWSMVRLLSERWVNADAVVSSAPWAAIRPSWRPEFPMGALRVQQWYAMYRAVVPGVGFGAVLAYLCVAGFGFLASVVLIALWWRRRVEAEGVVRPCVLPCCDD